MRDTRDGEGAARVGRRAFLLTVGGSLALGAVATDAEARRGSDEDDEYAVVQGDTCVPVVPLSGDEPVEELYDLRIPGRFVGDNGATDPGSGPYFQSNGTTDLQRVDATITFLYDGPEGLSFVVVHDSPNGPGGSVTWTLEDVPSDASWVVKDDLYLDPDTGEQAENNFDNWAVDGGTHVIDWTWGSAGTDGGALRPLDDEFGVVIDPAFNERSALWGRHYAEDPITDWQVLSFPDGRDDPERTSLSLDERVTIRAGGCDDEPEGRIADADEDDGKEDEKDEEKDGKRDEEREKDDDDEKDGGEKDRDKDEDDDEKDRDGDEEEDEKDRGRDDEDRGDGDDEDEDEVEGRGDEKRDDDEEGEDGRSDERKDDEEEKEDDEDGEEKRDEDESEGRIADPDEDEEDDGDDDDDEEDDNDDDDKEDDEDGEEKRDEDDGRGKGRGRGNGRSDDARGNGRGTDR